MRLGGSGYAALGVRHLSLHPCHNKVLSACNEGTCRNDAAHCEDDEQAYCAGGVMWGCSGGYARDCGAQGMRCHSVLGACVLR